MATEIKTWEIIEGKMKPVNSNLQENRRKEREDLEKWIKANPETLGEDIIIISEKVKTKSVCSFRESRLTRKMEGEKCE